MYVRISKQHGFKPPILKEIVFLRSKGHSNVEIADEIGVSRNTVSHYLEKMREMDDDEAAQLLSLVSFMMARHRRVMREMLKSFE